MLDILIPISFPNADLAVSAIENLSSMTKVPTRFVIMLDGGMRADYLQLETFLAGFDQPWKLLHNEKPVYLNQTIREGLEECTAKMVALIEPQVRIQDSDWFLKVNVIFQRDPAVGIVDTTPNTKSSTLHPIKRAHNRPASPGCPFAVMQTAFARKAMPYGKVDPVEHWSRTVMQQGGSSWAAPGVRYFITEHQEHELWRDPLEQPSRFA